MASKAGEVRGLRALIRRLRDTIKNLRSKRKPPTSPPTPQKSPSTPIIAPPTRGAPAPAEAAPSPQGVATQPRQSAGARPRPREAAEVEVQLRKIEELRAIEENARREREALEEKNAAQAPPIVDFDGFEKRKGFTYDTWFKALGTMEGLEDIKGNDSPTIFGEMEDLEDFSVPRAFTSGGIMGKVKWKGEIRPREEIIDQLNTVAPWNPSDFRDIYPQWEYRYRVAEMVGNVAVNVYEYKAKQPLSAADRAKGWKSE